MITSNTRCHIDPNTGDAIRCSKQDCGWGDHYATPQEARAYYEELMEDFLFVRHYKEGKKHKSELIARVH